MSGAPLRRVVIERLDDGRFELRRERDENGERFVCEDLIEAFACIRIAYWPDGSPRPWPPQKKESTP